MDGVILYQSKYGAAKKYADWLAEETGYPCMETKKADIKEIESTIRSFWEADICFRHLPGCPS